LGSNLLFPLARRRVPGLGLIHSGDALPNFLAVWASCALILLNLDRFSAAPVLPVMPYVLAVIVLPCLGLVALSLGLGRAGIAPQPQAIRDVLDESSHSDAPF
jgi:hypothetical protein